MTNTAPTGTALKPMAVLKRFFAPDANVSQMQAMIAGFKRPLKDDPDYVWCVTEAARELGVTVEWPSAA